MKTLKIACYEISEYQILEENEFNYLYPTLFKFNSMFGLDIFASNETVLNEKKLIELFSLIENVLEEIIKTNYNPPDLNKMSKYPGRFEKFIFKNRSYIVDYTFSSTGRLMYTLYLRLKFLEKIINVHGEGILIPIK